jgi:hypothetical protein
MISDNGLRLPPDHSNFNIKNYIKFAFVRSRRGSKKKVIGKIPTIIHKLFSCHNLGKILFYLHCTADKREGKGKVKWPVHVVIF